MEKLLNKLLAVNKELENKNGVNCLNLLEERLFILLQLGKYDEAIEEGYRVIGKEGPDSFTYKCILVGLCRTNRFDEARQVLDNWKKTSASSPRDKQCHSDVRSRLEPLLNGVRSGMNPVELFKHLEEQIGLSSNSILKVPNDSTVKQYKFRSPQPNQQAFFMCPRIANGIECLYGDKCFGAHTKDELEEWKQRGGKNVDNTKPGLISNNRIINYTMRSSNSTQIMPINRVNGAGNYLHPPPPNISYLKELIHTINTHPNIDSYLSENVTGVKVKCYGPLDVKIDKDTTTWTIVIGSRDPLRTVSLLNDLNRINFFISGGYYHYGTDNTTVNLIELHDCNRNNVLQVLNTFIPLQYLQTLGGWPEWFYYKILVTFRTLTTGRFKQTLVFDFKKEPKLVKNFSVEVVNEDLSSDSNTNPQNNYHQNLGELNLANIEKSLPLLPSPPTSTSSVMDKFNLNGLINESSLLVPSPGNTRTVYDAVTGVSVQLATIQDCHFDKNEIKKISKWNYTEIMGNILRKEKYFRHLELSRLNKIAQLNFSSTYLIDRNNESEMKICIPGEFYATINLERELSFSSICEDSRIGRLVLRSCNHVVLTPINQQHKPYLCRIVEKLSSSIIVVIGINMVQDLELNSDSSLVFKIEMQLESKGYEDMEYALSLLTVVESTFLFPDLSKEIYYDFDSLNSMLEGSYSLSQCQQMAYKAITSSIRSPSPVPPILLIGSFGSGKTYTLFQSIKTIVQLQPTARILICTHSNSAADLYITAVDEWLNEIQKSPELQKQNHYIEPLRIYYEDRHVPTVPKHIRKYTLFSIDQAKFRYPTKEEVAGKNIVVATLSTCLVLNKIGIGKGFFTHVIIDEAAQAMETEAIQPLLFADANTRVVIAGDHMQLSPELFFADDDDSFSLLERLHKVYPANHQAKVILTENYRTHESILQFASDEFYGGSLISATIQPIHSFYSPVSFVHVQGVERVGSTSFYNMEELTELTSRIKHIVSTWPMTWGKPEATGSIAVLSAYSDQVIRLRTHFRFSGLAYVTVDRVENVQGKQYRVVLISTVRTVTNLNEKTDLGFMSNPKLLNTALTRAQSLVIVVGDSLSLCSVGKCSYTWRNFINYSSKLNGLHGLDYNSLQSSIMNVEQITQTQINIDNPLTTSPWNIMESPQSSPSPPGFSSLALHNGHAINSFQNHNHMAATSSHSQSSSNNLLNIHENYASNNTMVNKDYNIHHIDGDAYFSISPEKPHLTNGLGGLTPIKKPAPGPISRPKLDDSFNNDLFNLACFESGIKEMLGEVLSPPKYNNKPQQQQQQQMKTIQNMDSQFQDFVHGHGMNENIRNGLPSPIARPAGRTNNVENFKENHHFTGDMFYDLWDAGPRSTKSNTNIHINGDGTANTSTSHSLMPPIVSQSTVKSQSQSQNYFIPTPTPTSSGCSTQSKNAQMNQLSAILSNSSNNVNDLNQGTSTDFTTDFKEPNNMMMMIMNKYSPQPQQQQQQNRLHLTPNTTATTEHKSNHASKSPIALESSDFPPLPEPSTTNTKTTPSSEWVQVKSKKSKTQTSSTAAHHPQPQQQQQQQNNKSNTTTSKSPEDLTSEEKIQVLVNMGFDKRRSIKALQHTERCLDKAVEILLNGHFKPSA